MKSITPFPLQIPMSASYYGFKFETTDINITSSTVHSNTGSFHTLPVQYIHIDYLQYILYMVCTYKNSTTLKTWQYICYNICYNILYIIFIINRVHLHNNTIITFKSCPFDVCKATVLKTLLVCTLVQ